MFDNKNKYIIFSFTVIVFLFTFLMWDSFGNIQIKFTIQNINDLHGTDQFFRFAQLFAAPALMLFSIISIFIPKIKFSIISNVVMFAIMVIILIFAIELNDVKIF